MKLGEVDVTVNQDIKALTPKEVLPDYIFYYVQARTMILEEPVAKMEQRLKALKHLY